MGVSTHLWLFIALTLLILARGAPDLASDRLALIAFRSGFRGASLRWNTTEASPCGWRGVICNNSRVTELRLPGVGLVGPIPAGTIGNLTALRRLSLRINGLTGPLPSDFSLLLQLDSLYLNQNGFRGEIPTVLFSLTQLVHLSLADNQLTGPISPQFDELVNLTTLYLEGNDLNGTIPDLGSLPLSQFNVSNNNLTGSIPAGLRNQPESAFLGNRGLCGGPLALCPGEESPASPASNSGKLSGGVIAGISIGVVLGIIILLVLVFVLCRKKDRDWLETAKSPESEKALRYRGEVPEIGQEQNRIAASASTANANGKKLVFLGRTQRIYDLEDLLRASAEVLGKGTMGTSYKALLEKGMVVVVKRLKDMNLPEKEFRDRITSIGSMDHPNLLTLQAYYYSKDEKLLVSDLAPNGSLSSAMHGDKGGKRTPLDWETRLNVALGAARGIEYIHLKGTGYSHGRIKSSNVLLSRSNEALVSDAGLCTIGSTVTPGRTIGYHAPEVTDARRISHKADVYSFGVLLLEMLTGKPPSRSVNNSDDGVDLPKWVQSIVREEWNSEVFDQVMLNEGNVEESMVELLQLGIDCVNQYPDKRPSMSEVVRRIEEIRGSNYREDVDVPPIDGL